jgi:UDP-N-acetylmuramate-alanine ligase
VVEENIPVPDPSNKTVEALLVDKIAMREAIAQLSTLVDSKLGGVQAVIAEQFKSIDKRLADRELTLVSATATQKENVATALAAVIESGKSGSVRFDLLERRVAALELAISGSLGKTTGSSAMTSGFLQAIVTAAAVISAMVAYFSLSHK